LEDFYIDSSLNNENELVYMDSIIGNIHDAKIIDKENTADSDVILDNEHDAYLTGVYYDSFQLNNRPPQDATDLIKPRQMRMPGNTLHYRRIS
jgi:hypothetical protein